MSQRGSAALEWALLVPVILVLMAGCALGARVAGAQHALDHAAAVSSRAATLERSAAAALSAAQIVAERELGQCTSHRLDIDVSEFARPLGQPASVRVEATCVVTLVDLGLPGPATVTLNAHGQSALDQYRERR